MIVGIYSLAIAAKGPPRLTNVSFCECVRNRLSNHSLIQCFSFQDQVLKFTNYFLSRKAVPSMKGAAELLEVLKLLADNPYHVPIRIALHGNPVLTKKQPILSVRVTNVLGRSLGTGLTVTIESPSLTRKALDPVMGDTTMFATDFLQFKPEVGVHVLTLKVTPPKGTNRMIGPFDPKIEARLASEVSIEKPVLRLSERDETDSFTDITLAPPAMSDAILDVSQLHKLSLTFGLTDVATNQPFFPHQVFVLFLNQQTHQEIVYVAEPDTASPNQYKFDLSVATRSKDFGYVSGLYHVSLIVGDTRISNPSMWTFIAIDLKFSDSTTASSLQQPASRLVSSKPVIHHIFKEQDKRPANLVSDFFTVLAASPLLILIGLWFKLGVNMSKFSFSFSTLLFHSGIASIFGLFTMFWLYLNIFSTIKYLLCIGIVTFLSGHRALRALATRSP